ncbi:hypothetical protein FBR04_01800 [Betaproteobacteria bacterium PRO7]|nr:hypothetical protein [Betaproteobacteria bacterium PRO7]
MRWMHASVPAAVCVSLVGGRRGSATRLLAGSLALPPGLREAANPVAFDAAAPGRVVSGGTFELAEAHAALAAALGSVLAPSLRRSFEWYVCRGAFFHNDAHYAGVLFGVWCVAGPPREIVFPRLGLRAAAAPGDWAVFDPFEPHAVLDPGAPTYDRAPYANARPSVFAGFEIELNEATRAAFAIAEEAPGIELSSRTRINAETGAIE